MSTGKNSLYLLIGKERFLKREFIDSLRQRLFSDGDSSGLNFQEFHAEENELSEWMDFLSTAPFGTSHRMGVLWSADLLDKSIQKKALSAIANLPSTSVFVLESEQSNAKKDVFLRQLAEMGKLTPCHAPFEKDLPVWVQTRAAKHKLSLDARTALFLIGCSGGELSALASSLQQLSAFVHPKIQATLEDAELLFQRRATDDVFRLAELVLDQQPAQALQVLDALIGEGARGPEIVGALATQMERWKKGAERLAQGRTPEEIGLEFRVPVFFQGAFISRLKRLPQERLKKITRALLDCDESFKSGQANERLALEKFIWTS